MKVLVLNGSPKGETSVTMQCIHFIQKKFPEHELKILHIAQKIRRIEKDDTTFREIIAEVESSDGILWAFPLYIFLVHSHYKRFIELIFERGAADAFHNKYTAVLTTSIHFFDHTAHNYMHAICDDLRMKHVGSFSAEMHDLLKETERQRLTLFAETFLEAAANNIPTSTSYKPLTHSEFAYLPGDALSTVDPGDKKVVILTDIEDNDTNLGRMVGRFKSSFSKSVETINLHDLDIKGGCLGCIRCGFDNVCAYQDSDEFVNFYNKKLKTADVLVFAGTIKDRYLSSRWKLFFDRGFFNTHTPSLIGKQFGFIISGPLRQIPNLRQILEAYTEWQQANLVDVITDEYKDSAEIDALLDSLAKRLIRFAEKHYIRPRTFLGVGGMRIFRDDIWGKLRFVFQADHRFYKRHGIYDFPQKDFKTRIRNAVMMLLTKIPRVRREFPKRIKAKMIEPHQKMLEKQRF